ncbi:MAG TPA: methyltransferase [Isosphaeraceae bacterium]|nr:methyltransferase [Isosphaeraceae bacterium]
MSERAPSGGTSSVPPSIGLLNLTTGKWVSQALYVAAKLGIADLLREGPTQCDELARANQVDGLSLYRVLRALASVGVFTEVSDRTFALTPMAEYLRSDIPGSLRALAMLGGEEPWWQAWGDIWRSVKTGEPAVERLFGMGTFDYLPEHPGVSAIFDEAMTGASTLSAAAIARAYDFTGIETLVDVGGGHGLLLTTILKAHPHLRGILYDAPHVIEGASQRIELAGLADRCEAVGGNFFESVPSGADAYLLCHIIHDWDDPRSLKILNQCHRAMGRSGRLLIAESVIPAGNDPNYAKFLDLEMLVMAGGRERTEAEYRDLLDQAGFQLARVVPTLSSTSVVEGVPA